MCIRDSVDIMLPGRDGYSLLPKLKQYEIPVIFLTAKGDIASKIKGLKDGAEDYIVKPVSYTHLCLSRAGKGIFCYFRHFRMNGKTEMSEE